MGSLFALEFVGYAPAVFRHEVVKAADRLGSMIRNPSGVEPTSVTVFIPHIDGSGAVLAEAAPTAVNRTTRTSSAGYIRFDRSDIFYGLETGSMQQTAEHELLHVLGFGTMPWWPYKLAGPDGYEGDEAVNVWESETGLPGPVPLERSGGAGTAGGHWSEHVFGNELMTGYLSSTNCLSKYTLAAMQDLGYEADLESGDEYMLPSSPLAVHVSLTNNPHPARRCVLPQVQQLKVT